MAEWLISPAGAGATIDNSGNAHFPANTTEDYKEYRITYRDDSGCTSYITYEVPPATPMECTCANVESKIIYEHTHLDTSAESNVLLFSANTRGCAAVSAYCSSTEDSIFTSTGDNLVRVVEKEEWKRYEVRANVRSLPSGAAQRSCVVNIYIKMRDGTECATILKTFIQNPTLNCSTVSSNYYDYNTRFVPKEASTKTEIGSSKRNRTHTTQSVKLLVGDFDWISDPSTFIYKLIDGEWHIYANVQANPGDERSAKFDQYVYIFDNQLSEGVEYTANQLESMAVTRCGKKGSFTVKQQGCGCVGSWKGAKGQSGGMYTLSYSPSQISKDGGDFTINLADVIDFDCLRVASHTTRETYDYLHNVTLVDGNKINYSIDANNTGSERTCDIMLTLTKINGDTCDDVVTESYIRLKQGAGSSFDCNNCSDIKARINKVNQGRLNANGSERNVISYASSIITDCNGTVTITFDTSGSNPIQNPRVTKTLDGSSSKECYVAADANDSSSERKCNAIVSYTNASISDCTDTIELVQPSSQVHCSSSSYDFNLQHTYGGADINNPIIFSANETKNIGTLANSIPSEYASCCGVEASTVQTSVIGDFDITPKAGGGYTISGKAKSLQETATVDVKWWYDDGTGKKYSSVAGIIYIKVQ